jgi:hypothetical protein
VESHRRNSIGTMLMTTGYIRTSVARRLLFVDEVIAIFFQRMLVETAGAIFLSFSFLFDSRKR